MRFSKGNKHISKPDGKIQDKGKVSGKRVLIYVPTITGKMDVLFIEGYVALLNDCWSWKAKGWEFFPVYGKGMFIQHARNLAVDHALENNMDYILYIDDDMVLPTDRKLFTELVNHDKDIVAPLFFHKDQPYAPLIFRKNMYGGGNTSYTTYDNILDYKKGLVQVDGVGFGTVLIKTEVFRKMEKPYFVYGDSCGEDLYFCEHATAKGFKVWADTTLQVGHIGKPTVSYEGSFIANRESTELYMKQKIESDVKRANKMLSENKDTKKKVSVVLTCENEEYIKNSIESILHQTYPNFELIIKNATNGNAQKFIDTFNDPRITKKATGDYITELTDSGWFYPQRLEVMVNSLKDGKNKMCHTKRAVYRNDKKKNKLELLREEQSKVYALKERKYKGDKSLFINTTMDGFISCEKPQ